MTVNGWLQILFFSACVLLVAKPLGIYLVRVYDGSVRWLAPVERVIYRLGGVDPTEDQHWTRYAAAMLLFSASSTMLLTYLVLRLQQLLPLNPQHLAAVHAIGRRSRRRRLHDQHQLAVVQRRERDVVLLADDAARVSQLCLGRGGDGGAPWRWCAASRGERRAASGTSGSTRARHAVCAAPAVARRRAAPGAAGGASRTSPYLDGHHARRGRADDRDGAGGEPGGDQAAGDERRRLLQRQRGAPVREPHAVDQLLVDDRDLHDPVGADVHARADGEEPAARLGGVGGDVHCSSSPASRRRIGPRRGAIRSMPRAGSTSRRRATIRAATWKGRRSASASPTPRSTPRSPRTRPAAR